MKLCISHCAGSRHTLSFENFTSCDRSTNVVNPHTWTHWMVDKHKLSLMHANTSLHTTTLRVPNFDFVDKVLIKETLENITELIMCSLNDNLHAECIVKEACMMNENLDSLLHE